MQENGPMSLVKWTFIGLAALPAAEFLALILVAALIGWLWTAALFVATSVVGVLLLRKSGRADLDRVRNAFARDGIRAIHLETPGVAPVIGGILLIFPGFITDILGAALYVPPLRRWAAGKLAERVGRTGRRHDEHVIDLEPGEWHHLPDQRRRRRKPRDRAEHGS
jgi:UPF0716 family protein affecting phage T7 exclusion